MVRPSGRIVSSCIQFGPVVGLGKSAWGTVRSFSCTRRVSAAFHFQAKAGIGSGAREGRAPSRPKLEDDAMTRIFLIALFNLLVLGGEVMGRTADLTLVKKRKKDEFYTQLVDIENELRHYREHFKGKVVLCNCDDPRRSNFFKYFADNFEKLQLKRLIATCYKSQDVDLFSQGDCERAICQVYEGDRNGNLVVDDDEVSVRELKGDGDFRSAECVELLKEADIVVTNPPFSLFREYVAQLVKYEKKFLIIGNQNAITYKEIFPLFMNNSIWLGYGFRRNCAHFETNYKDEASDADHRAGMIRVSGVMWYTNLEIAKRHEIYPLYKRYSPEEFPVYDNYDAIEVGRACDIPMDFPGVMGVPITFMDKFNPLQFELIGATESEGKGFSHGLWREDSGISQPLLKGEKLYKRIFIRHRSPAK